MRGKEARINPYQQAAGTISQQTQPRSYSNRLHFIRMHHNSQILPRSLCLSIISQTSTMQFCISRKLWLASNCSWPLRGRPPATRRALFDAVAPCTNQLPMVRWPQKFITPICDAQRLSSRCALDDLSRVRGRISPIASPHSAVAPFASIPLLSQLTCRQGRSGNTPAPC
jgi:hypothetical protein